METSEKSAFSLLVRYVAYVVLLFIQYLLLTYVVLPKNWSFGENGIIEWLQVAFLILLFITLGGASLIYSQMRKVLLLLMSCSMLAIARELDKILDIYIPVLGWKIIFLLVVPLILLQFRNGSDLRRQLLKFATSPAMGIFLTAIIVILPLAQCIGDRSYLRVAMGDDYVGKYKVIFEESMELYGYLLLLCGAVETILFARQHQKACESTDIPYTSCKFGERER